MKRGQIWSIDLTPSAGHEMRGRHFVLIISHNDFNAAFSLPCVVPITSGGRLDREKGFAISLIGTGTRTQGVIVCSQYRTVDVKSRGGRYIEDVPDYILDLALDNVRATLD